MKLYELSQSYAQLLDMADSVDEEVFRDTLSSIEEELEDKVENIARFIRCLESDVEAIKVEEKRLADKRRAIENKIASTKEYVQHEMEVAGLNKVKRATVTVSIQANPPSVEVTDESLIPSTYMIPVAPKLDKRSILVALKNGEFIPGATIKRTTGVRIK